MFMGEILIIAPYSFPSRCGILKRVSQDIEILGKQNNITVFSSNIKKGTSETLPFEGEYNGTKIFRFPVRFKLGGTSMFFFFWNKLNQLNPDVIHVHGYRHPHCIQGLLWAKINKKKILITTHGPFRKDPRRSVFLKLIDILYDIFIGWWELRMYDHIITVANWEVPFLKRRLAPVKKISVVPNGLDSEFLENKPILKLGRLINALYMGRIEKVKRADWIVEASKKNKDYVFTIFGPHQDKSLNGIEETDNLKIINKPYDSSTEFIEVCKAQDIFILPSIRESFGIVGLEAMSQGLLLISSNTFGVKEYLINGENGFIVNNSSELIDLLKKLKTMNNIDSIIQKGREASEKYSINYIAPKLLKIYTKFT